MKQVQKLKDQCYHVFEDASGNEVVEKCTLEEYRALAKQNAGQPKREGHTWKFSIESIEFDTPTGFLDKGCYWDAGDGTFVVSLDDERKFRNFNITKENVLSGDFTSAGISELRSMGVTLDSASRLDLKNIK